MNRKPIISFIVPVFNEEENILPLYNSVSGVMKKIEDEFDYEIFFTNNRSTDNTWELIRELHDKDKRVKGIRYSKNFGYQRSIYQGYLSCNGDVALQLDCDLQDDPNLVYEFLEKWKSGAKVVFGVRQRRKESLAMELARKIYYRVVNFLSDEELPHDVGEFVMINRDVIEQLRYVNDHQPYLRGIIATLGFEQAKVYYSRDDRKRGMTKFNLKGLFLVAFDGIFNFSVVPLRLALYFGILISCITTLLMVFYIISRLSYGMNWPAGFTTITILILFGLGINGIFLGIIGEYIGRIYKQIKRSQIAIIDEKIL